MREAGAASLARWSAASMTIAAGAIHLGQVGIHWYEAPLFGPFFLIVGALQVLGGLYLARPLGPPNMRRGVARLGIVGSLGVIGIWAASRSLGLPFGAEPGEREEVGQADMAANVLELFTAFLLAAWLRQADAGKSFHWVRWSLVGSLAAGTLALGWAGLRALGVFDPDPRLVLEPELTDAAAVGSLVAIAALFGWLGLRSPGTAPRVAGIALVASLVALEGAFVAITMPGAGGQNRECRYAPLAEDSGHSTAEASEPIEMEVGERRSVVVMFLMACADAPVDLVAVVPRRATEDVVVIASSSVDRTRQYWSDRVRDRPSAEAVPLEGVRMLPGAGRYPVTIEVRAVAPGRADMNAFRVDYVYRGSSLSFGFASITSVCVGEGCEHK